MDTNILQQRSFQGPAVDLVRGTSGNGSAREVGEDFESLRGFVVGEHVVMHSLQEIKNDQL